MAVLCGLKTAVPSRCATPTHGVPFGSLPASTLTWREEFKLKYLKLMSFQVSMLLLHLIWVLKILMQLYSLFGGKILDKTSERTGLSLLHAPAWLWQHQQNMEADVQHLAATVRTTCWQGRHYNIDGCFWKPHVCHNLPRGSHSSSAMFCSGKGWQEVKAWQWLICQCGCSGSWRILALSLWVSTLKYLNKILALSEFASEIQRFPNVQDYA